MTALDARHLGPEAVRRELRRAGLAARHALSQNFLVDGEVLEAIAAEARSVPGRRTVEVGPGLGVLTAELLAAGAAVTAVELDRRLVDYLRGRFREALWKRPRDAGSLRLIEGDILEVPFDELAIVPYDVVANLPYHITSPVLHLFLGAEERPDRMVLLVQREVAERITAAPGQMSYLSVFVRYHAAARVARVVSAAAFEPAPEVASALLVLEIHARPLGSDRDAEERLWRVVQAAFRERRKMIHNVLPRQLPTLDAGRLADALRRAAVEPTRRPQSLALDEWLRLAEAIGPLP